MTVRELGCVRRVRKRVRKKETGQNIIMFRRRERENESKSE